MANLQTVRLEQNDDILLVAQKCNSNFQAIVQAIVQLQADLTKLKERLDDANIQ
jgi:ribosome-associated translation inhibitor RaiA